MNTLSNNRHLYLGFHGCEKSLAYKLINRQVEMNPSKNDYDWLGTGCYFWENDIRRAYEFAKDIKKCKEPFVVGAILDLGYCLDLTCRNNLLLIKDTYNNIVKPLLEIGKVKTNKVSHKSITDDILLRYLDCSVIESLHQFNKDKGYHEYDSVRAGFWEGGELYETAGFREKNHIQICIRNPKCILGLFLPNGYAL